MHAGAFHSYSFYSSALCAASSSEFTSAAAWALLTYKMVHSAHGMPRRGETRVMVASTDGKHVELDAARKMQTLCDISQHAEDMGDGIDDHEKLSGKAALLGFLRSFDAKEDTRKGNRDGVDFVSGGVLNDDVLAAVKERKLSVDKRLLTREEWVKNHESQDRAHDKNDARNKSDRFQEAVSFVALLKEVTIPRDLQKGSSLHADIINRDLLKGNIFLGSALINMYAKCGALEKAQEVFDELCTRNVVYWNALVAGYAQHGHGKKALACFAQMQRAGLSPDAMTYSCILKACGSLGAVEKGKEVHVEMAERGLLGTNIVLANALMYMYTKCGALEKAQRVFSDLPARNLVSWTTLIAGYCQHGQSEKALHLFEQMNGEGLSLDAVTLRCILKACGSVGAADKGKEVHTEIARKGFLSKDCNLGSALVDMYAKCGDLAAAQGVFDELPVHDIVAWTALIAGYAQHGQGNKALSCLEEMEGEGLLPNSVTLLCLLKACCSIGAADKGKMIHADAIRQGFLGEDCIFGNALVDMYAKCGALPKSYHVFDELQVRTVVAWTALIAGYGKVGKHAIVFDLFNRMIREGTDPTSVTFLVVLHSCSYLGLVREGQMYFEMMSKGFGIIPNLDHCTSMVDLLGKSGHFDKALAMIMKLPSLNNHVTVWFTLLTSCQRWGNAIVGKAAFNHLIGLAT